MYHRLKEHIRTRTYVSDQASFTKLSQDIVIPQEVRFSFEITNTHTVETALFERYAYEKKTLNLEGL